MQTRDGKKWHSVSVKPGRSGCKAVQELKHKRWLSKDAPVLPLKDCQQPGHCSCVYQHHADRRAGDGRRAEENDRFQAPKKPTSERRRGPNRRRLPED